MRRHSGSLVGGVIVALLALTSGQAPRAQSVSVFGDLPATPVAELPKGTGLILGRVVEAEARTPVDRAIVWLTSAMGVIDPVMTDGQGRFVFRVILFPADQALWRAGVRRILQVRPGTDGRFTLRNLLPGDYLLAAATDVEAGQWLDPEFLTALQRAAVSVKIEIGEKKTQDIRIAK